MNTLLAGDHVVATDACMANMMGHDPSAGHSPEGHIDMSRRELAGSYKNESLFLKFVDPEEREEERFEVYERTL